MLLLSEMPTSEVSLHLYHYWSSLPKDLTKLPSTGPATFSDVIRFFWVFLLLEIPEKYLENWNYSLKEHLILLFKYWSGGSTF